MKFGLIFFMVTAMVPAAVGSAQPVGDEMRLRMTWGHRTAEAAPLRLELVGRQVTIDAIAGYSLETGEAPQGTFIETRAGGGDVDGVDMILRYQPWTAPRIDLPPTWRALIEMSDPDTAVRLRRDAEAWKDPRQLTVKLNPEGTRGFSIKVGQLLQARSIWIPALDVYVSAGDAPQPLDEHLKQIGRGRRVLDQVRAEPEASYEQFTSRWEDMGSPAYKHPSQPAPGHIVCMTWDSAIHKYGIDRSAGVWNDYGNPDRFRLWLDLGEASRNLEKSWKGQKLADGLPLITTTLEADGLRYEVEQFAYPLNGPPQERRGDIPMVLMQRVRLTNLEQRAMQSILRLHHQRQLPRAVEMQVSSETGAVVGRESLGRGVLFTVQGEVASDEAKLITTPEPKEKDAPRTRHVETALQVKLAPGATRELIIKLPSPAVEAGEASKLLGLDYASARAGTSDFWSGKLAEGAHFSVPEPVVNELFRANLWHALRLPRRHGGGQPGVRIDLPYSNFAYDQNGIPWPINQAVYVDYMIYDLRGHHAVSVEELEAMFRGNQEPSGHIKGFANWVVYTPSMAYVVAKNYLLSGDRAALERLLPQTLKALDWCLAEIRRAKERPGPSSGLVYGPLNDLTGEGVWAFSQAYVYAALEIMGKVLREIEHPRAAEISAAATEFRSSVERGFGAAAVNSPLVQLRDHTWVPYVPTEALTPGRRFDQWYITDADTGSMHLSRLQALPPEGALTDFLLHDHEENLYLHGWGMANEPVYNPQATVYLYRDDPKAIIRAFYSYMACSFSHSALEPVEHRWVHGQYFGPPSTDGAWFELYRNMLIRELDDDSLLLMQATPRRWLEDGKRIEVRKAPTYFGTMSVTVESRADRGEIAAAIEMPGRKRPKSLLIRLRHPQAKPIRTITINGADSESFDPAQEWIRIGNPAQRNYRIVARYE